MGKLASIDEWLQFLLWLIILLIIEVVVYVFGQQMAKWKNYFRGVKWFLMGKFRQIDKLEDHSWELDL